MELEIVMVVLAGWIAVDLIVVGFLGLAARSRERVLRARIAEAVESAESYANRARHASPVKPPALPH